MHTSNIASSGYAVPNPCDELWLHTLLNTNWEVVVTGKILCTSNHNCPPVIVLGIIDGVCTFNEFLRFV